MPREIEIKVRVSDTKAFVQFLNAEAEFTGEQHQIDEYFTPPDRDFTVERPVNEWLRLRTTDKGSSINYKLWHRDPVDGKSLYGDESESGVGDVKAMRDILVALEFRSLCTVDKIRKTWRYGLPATIPDRHSERAKRPKNLDPSRAQDDSHSETYEIALDTEKTLGYFIEVELIGETTEEIPIVRDRMLQFLRDHGITNPEADQVGYPYLLLFGDTNNQ